MAISISMRKGRRGEELAANLACTPCVLECQDFLFRVINVIWNAPWSQSYGSESRRSLSNPDLKIQDGGSVRQQEVKAVIILFISTCLCLIKLVICTVLSNVYLWTRCYGLSIRKIPGTALFSYLEWLTKANLARTCFANCWYWFSDYSYWDTSIPALTSEINEAQHKNWNGHPWLVCRTFSNLRQRQINHRSRSELSSR